jgi:C1A family cysteine protease
MPLPRAQADTSTCVSWAVTYAAASLALRPRFPGLTLSPAFTYNQVARDPTCQSGTAASKTLNMLRDVGALPVDEFAFDAGSCDRIPSAAELQSAARYKIKSWSSFDARNLDMMKQQLARGAAVMFSMRTGPKMRALRGDDVLDTDTPNGGGHQLVVVGYDDAKQAFKIQNSWGKGWGNGGYGWFSYDFWKQTIRVAYVID